MNCECCSSSVRQWAQLQAGRPGQLLHQSHAQKGCRVRSRKACFRVRSKNRDENVDYYVAKFDELVKKSRGLTDAASAPEQESLAL
jgi:hypothetical protein